MKPEKNNLVYLYISDRFHATSNNFSKLIFFTLLECAEVDLHGDQN